MLLRAILILGMAGRAVAQDKREQQPSAREQLQQIHSPQSIDEEHARLDHQKELERRCSNASIEAEKRGDRFRLQRRRESRLLRVLIYPGSGRGLEIASGRSVYFVQ
jgi:hypothetical protein